MKYSYVQLIFVIKRKSVSNCFSVIFHFCTFPTKTHKQRYTYIVDSMSALGQTFILLFNLCMEARAGYAISSMKVR